MTTEEYLKFHEEICKQARDLSKRKNNDYSAPDRFADDPLAIFKNFMLVKTMGVCSVEQGFLTRLSDKFQRLCNLLGEGHVRTVADETVKDTVQDIINYVILLLAYKETVARECLVIPSDKDITSPPFDRGLSYK